MTPSWHEVFSDRYDAWSADMTADLPFYVGLAREADGPIVELAVGTGRVAVPVALASGRPVIGMDTSPGMLRQARSHAAEAAGVRTGGGVVAAGWAFRMERVRVRAWRPIPLARLRHPAVRILVA